MPTPSDDTLQHFIQPVPLERAPHATCPPDNGRVEEWRNQEYRDASQANLSDGAVLQQPGETDSFDTGHNNREYNEKMKMDDIEQEQSSTDGQSPISIGVEAKDTDVRFPLPPTSSTDYEISDIRRRPNHTSSFLRAGSKFEGTQRSDRQRYRVEVDIKHVDMDESFLCGYLRIEGLTKDHPTLTTYFEGEIIGAKYEFQTKHDSWGAKTETDMQHWARFPAWRPLAKQARKPDFHFKNCAQRENIFMRWKEYFLVPDHRVGQIPGASFEGFYYICFNQVAGTVSGIYFHANSEKYQQLELAHVNDQGCLAAVEFR